MKLEENKGQRAKLLIKFPQDYNVADLDRDLEGLGCKVEIQGVFIQFLGFPVLDSFKFKNEDIIKQTKGEKRGNIKKSKD